MFAQGGERCVGKFGGQPQMSATERSLYPYSFSVDEEAGIVGRLRGSPRLTEPAEYRH